MTLAEPLLPIHILTLIKAYTITKSYKFYQLLRYTRYSGLNLNPTLISPSIQTLTPTRT